MFMKFFVTTLFFLIIVACSETQDKFYSNIDEAIKHGAIEKGWIPNILPRSSSEIYERHDLDTNTVWLRFRFDKIDKYELTSQIEEVKTNEISSVSFSTPHIRWWPKDLNKDFFTKGQPGLKLYKYKRVLQYADNSKKIVPAFIVIDWNSNIAYYWQYSN